MALRGKGLTDESGINMVGNTALKVLEPPEFPGRHAVPMSRTLMDFFVANEVFNPRGPYELVFACRNRLDFEDLHTFTATLDITRKGYRAIGSSAVPLEQWLAQEPDRMVTANPGDAEDAAVDVGDPSELPATVGDADGTTGDPLAGDEAPDPEEAAEFTAQQSPAPAEEAVPWRALLGGIGVLLLLGAGYAWWRQRKVTA